MWDAKRDIRPAAGAPGVPADFVGGEVVLPGNTSYTCTREPNNMLDHGVFSRGARNKLESFIADFTTPSFNMATATISYQQLLVPGPFASCKLIEKSESLPWFQCQQTAGRIHPNPKASEHKAPFNGDAFKFKMNVSADLASQAHRIYSHLEAWIRSARCVNEESLRRTEGRSVLGRGKRI